MIVTLAEIKTYLNELTTDNDVFLTQQLAVVNSAIENYCGRKFDPVSYTQVFHRDDIEQIRVPYLYTYHYPVTSITSITDDNADVYVDYRLRGDRGRVVLEVDGYKVNWFCGYDKVEIVFNAGYTTMPEDLKQCVYSLVSESYNKMINGVGIEFGKGIQRVSVAGVMSIDFDYTLEANDRSSAFGMILGDWANVLDFYRSERSVLSGEIWENYVS